MAQPQRRPHRPVFEIYRDAAGEWRWRLVAGNGRIVADSGEGYSRKASARCAAARAAALAASTSIRP